MARVPPRRSGENRGGRRQGTPGKAYGQRTDLNMNRQAVATGPSQGYGQRAAQERAQQAVPLAAAPPTPTGAPAGGPGAGAPPAAFPPAGSFGPLDRPTDRPDEPVTAGAPIGPGPGPEALSFTGAAGQPRDPDLESLRPYLPTLELLASMPNTSPTARNFVRRLRGSMPPPPGAGGTSPP